MENKLLSQFIIDNMTKKLLLKLILVFILLAGIGYTTWRVLSGPYDKSVPIERLETTDDNEAQPLNRSSATKGLPPQVIDGRPLVQPSVTVTTPNGGEYISFGDRYVIKWMRNFNEDVKIFLISEQCAKQQCFQDDPIITQWPDIMIITQRTPNIGEYVWHVPELSTETSPRSVIPGPEGGLGYKESINPREMAAPLGKYKVIVMRNWEARYGRIFDESDMLFSIVQ
jgi:hypothetical protein